MKNDNESWLMILLAVLALLDHLFYPLVILVIGFVLWLTGTPLN